MDEHGHGRSGDGGEIIGDVLLTGVEGEDAYLSEMQMPLKLSLMRLGARCGKLCSSTVE
jgi:hypothetical protein